MNSDASKSPTVLTPEPATAPTRLASLDAYRGAIMLLMASGGLGLAEIAKEFPDSSVWQILGHQSGHVQWAGCALWDLIQPAFMFMVGISLPWSLASRSARGQSFQLMLAHALWRSLLLVLLAVFLSSAWSEQTNWVFTNVLAQIGLGYPLLFLLAFTKSRTTWIAAFSILALYWMAFALHPLPPADFDWQAVGVPPDWSWLTGFAAHWEKNANFASNFDLWFLNLFPRDEPFTFNRGGYATLNFIPSLATMTFGLLAGRLLRSDLPMSGKLMRLVLAGLLGIALGMALDLTGICPIVKRIWTPAWTLYSTGFVAIMLAVMVALVDGLSLKRLAFPLMIVGLNPITLYCLFQLSTSFIRKQLQIHLGQDVFSIFGDLWIPMMQRACVLLILWLIILWMYRRKVFLRL
ncbi:acyltransferase family protein [Aureliella helgolandensis]|uniref:DUF5009 domain-containing protein n=1 Tax=Aureliella helgolandensis TaxID=2527968 RepID=A0A518G1L3_9BACT|nr:hypothetical protein [Aureliella helgolandensis]QDV22491.1 hypothetical protein Q31a_07770 [Aureliella helgolandensis]